METQPVTVKYSTDDAVRFAGNKPARLDLEEAVILVEGVLMPYVLPNRVHVRVEGANEPWELDMTLLAYTFSVAEGTYTSVIYQDPNGVLVIEFKN